jgi:DNA-binding beta-propeller fold protein YncE
MNEIKWSVLTAAPFAIAIFAGACNADPTGPTPGPAPSCETRATLTPAAGTGNLTHRAYVASRDSGNVTVIDLDSLEIVASVDTCAVGYHMVELSSDFTTVFASSSDKDQIDVLDVRSLGLTKQIAAAGHPTHISLNKDGTLLAAVVEDDDTVVFIDTVKQVERKRLPGFKTPHFVRFAADGRYAYVANMGAYHISRVDLTTLTIDREIMLEGRENAPAIVGEGGFADAQIDENGVLWAAHNQTGQVLLYDTLAHTKLPEISGGTKPWIVYAEHPFKGIAARVLPNHGDRNVALLTRGFAAGLSGSATVMTGEPESYGVNYSPLAPEKAFVMNRLRQEVAVVNTTTRRVDATIDVGGNTETASTTADGRYIVAAVSSKNRVVVIDATTNAIVKAFENVGSYPWTVTIPLGQNY